MTGVYLLYFIARLAAQKESLMQATTDRSETVIDSQETWYEGMLVHLSTCQNSYRKVSPAATMIYWPVMHLRPRCHLAKPAGASCFC